MPSTTSQLEEGRLLHWDVASRDYLEHRPGYPDSYFELLQRLGVGLAGQDILDLGAGTGALTIPFARQGARVVGVDLSAGQIEAAREAAARQGVAIDFKVAPAEVTGLPDHAFDVISASMCWGYFDVTKMVVEVPRMLRAGGRLLIGSLLWQPDGDAHGIAARSNELIATYNPGIRTRERGVRGEIVPEWSRPAFRLQTYHDFTADITFTRESWRGRLRACRWTGAALPPAKTQAFDRDLAALLERIAPPTFSIPHRIVIQIFAVA
ncbi:MAG: methyltransferase domain-containing protein [Opitutaceae bacterium]|nr:methyltransferase domain-containing protein [Opitutaceae bacterium]